MKYEAISVITAPGLVQAAGIPYLVFMREQAGTTPFFVDLSQDAPLGIAALAAGFGRLVLHECPGFPSLQNHVDAYPEARLYSPAAITPLFPLYAEVATKGEKIAYQMLEKWLEESR